MHKIFTHFAQHSSVKDPHYFENNSLVEKRITCMDVIRDAFFEFLGENYVRAAPAPASPVAPPVVPAPVLSPSANHDSFRGIDQDIVSKDDQGILSKDDQGSKDDQESRVISDVFENNDEWKPANNNEFDDDSSIGPNDSVSCIDFAEKQQKQIARMRCNTTEPIIREDDADPEDGESKTESRTSLSLSSVSLTERGPVMKSHSSSVTTSATPSITRPSSKQNDNRSIASSSDNSTSVTSSHSSMSSVREKKPASKKKKFAPRSYITSLTEESM